MKVPYLLDTNVLIYAFSGEPAVAPKKALARQWVAREDWGLSTQVLMELYANLIKPRHALDAAKALQLTQHLAASRPVQSTDAQLVLSAAQLAQHSQISLWDAAILCAARRMGAHAVVSEDLNAGQTYAGVQVINPFAGLPAV